MNTDELRAALEWAEWQTGDPRDTPTCMVGNGQLARALLLLHKENAALREENDTLLAWHEREGRENAELRRGLQAELDHHEAAFKEAERIVNGDSNYDSMDYHHERRLILRRLLAGDAGEVQDAPVGRFVVDDRVGIIAIRDTQHPDRDPQAPGLHMDYADVVCGWYGQWDGERWSVDPVFVQMAQRTCDLLNELADCRVEVQDAAE